MPTKEEIKKEFADLIKKLEPLLKLTKSNDDILKFGTKYQIWYTKALKLVEVLAPDRLDEFIGYYRIDPKRKVTDAGNYVLQDYIKGIGARTHLGEPLWDTNNLAGILLYNQIQILTSLSSRIDSVLSDVEGHLYAELQDHELKAATKLKKISLRAAGALAGVVLEKHLQRAAKNHKIPIRKKEPTIADLNDPLKKASVYDTPVWRKIQLLADLRNICSHQKSKNPTDEQVDELIDGVNTIIKSVF